MICPNCQTENPSNAKFCRRCSFVLQDDRPRKHTAMLSSDVLDRLPNVPKPPRREPAEEPATETRSGLLRLELIEEAMIVTIPIMENISLGRPDPLTNSVPDIDFTQLRGYKLGVSRRHAEIHWYHDNLLHLYDLGSSNGTFLNRKRLPINTPVPIFNGDIIALGELAMYVYYEIQADGTIIPLRSQNNEEKPGDEW